MIEETDRNGVKLMIRALYRSAETRRPVRLGEFRRRRPEPAQEIRRPPVRKPELVHAEPPSGDS